MEKPFRYRFGAALALLAAGPVFLLSLMLITLLTSPTHSELGSLNGLLVVAMFSIPFGIAFGAIPILLGGLVMGWLGVDVKCSRHPIIWGLTGALAAQPMALVIFDGLKDAPVLFAFTGAICALIVRYGTRWSDDST